MAKRFEFRIHGMDCADEVAILRREIEPIVKEPGRLSFDILRGKMNVDQGDPAVTEAGRIGREWRGWTLMLHGRIFGQVLLEVFSGRV